MFFEDGDDFLDKLNKYCDGASCNDCPIGNDLGINCYEISVAVAELINAMIEAEKPKE